MSDTLRERHLIHLASNHQSGSPITTPAAISRPSFGHEVAYTTNQIAPAQAARSRHDGATNDPRCDRTSTMISSSLPSALRESPITEHRTGAGRSNRGVPKQTWPTNDILFRSQDLTRLERAGRVLGLHSVSWQSSSRECSRSRSRALKVPPSCLTVPRSVVLGVPQTATRATALRITVTTRGTARTVLDFQQIQDGDCALNNQRVEVAIPRPSTSTSAHLLQSEPMQQSLLHLDLHFHKPKRKVSSTVNLACSRRIKQARRPRSSTTWRPGEMQCPQWILGFHVPTLN